MRFKRRQKSDDIDVLLTWPGGNLGSFKNAFDTLDLSYTYFWATAKPLENDAHSFI